MFFFLVQMWFSQNATPQPTAPESGAHKPCSCTDGSWPPRFQTYEEFKGELDVAISECPGFGEWLLLYRNINHVNRSDPPLRSDPSPGSRGKSTQPEEAIWCLTVLELKKRYITHTEKVTNARNGKRAFIEMHLEKRKAVYDAEEEEFAPTRTAYQLAMEVHSQARAGGYGQYLPLPPSPTLPEGLRERDSLLHLLETL